jgi:hypothetical protein
MFVTFIAILFGIAGWFLFVYDWRVSLPLAIFYALLVINTYPSVQLFSSIVPLDDGKHALVDIILAFSYLFLAVSLGQPQQFAICALVLFLIAAGKYSLMLYEVPHQKLIERKLRVDLLGALMCAIVLALISFGWFWTGVWGLAIMFALANVYVLALRPLYRL